MAQTVFLVFVAVLSAVSCNLLSDYDLEDDSIRFAAAMSKLKDRAISECNEPQLDYCQRTFNTQLGIDASWGFAQGTQLWNAVQKVLAKDVDGVRKICTSRTQYQQCLGTSYYTCLNLYVILSQFSGQSDFQNAFDYSRTFLGLEFTCSAGFQEVVRQWDCLHGIQTTNGYNKCMDAFNNASTPVNLCNAVSINNDCLTDAYLRGCQDKGAGYYGCEQFRYTFNEVCWGQRCTVKDYERNIL